VPSFHNLLPLRRLSTNWNFVRPHNSGVRAHPHRRRNPTLHHPDDCGSRRWLGIQHFRHRQRSIVRASFPALPLGTQSQVKQQVCRTEYHGDVTWWKSDAKRRGIRIDGSIEGQPIEREGREGREGVMRVQTSSSRHPYHVLPRCEAFRLLARTQGHCQFIQKHIRFSAIFITIF